MTRLVAICGVFLIGMASAFGQLPNQHGQIWREYVFAPNVSVADKPQDAKSLGAEIIGVIKRETGEAAWTGGGTMGLIGCDASKLYVYHTPAIHAHVGDVVSRFTRPESRDVCFAAEVRFVTRSHVSKEPVELRQQLTPYLRPLRAVHDGKPAYQTCGVTAFWVAKENVAAFQEALRTQLNTAMASPTGNLLQAPKVVTFNGQRGFVNDTTQHTFVTSVIPVMCDMGTTYQSDVSVVDAGMKLELFSLLTSDARSVSTDVSLVQSCIDKVDKYSFSGARMVGLDEAPSDVAVYIQVPHVEKIEIAETGLVWPRDGMLVVFLTGIERQQEVRSEAGVPVLHKIPYLNRMFKTTAIGRELVSVAGIITVNAFTAQDRAIHAANTASRVY